MSLGANCSSKTDDYVYYSSFLTLIASCLSIFGSFLIILTFILWKDVRQSVARIILLFLALADLGTGLGYLISSTGYIIHHHYQNETHSYYQNDSNTTWYHRFCTGTSFFTTFFPVSSFFWTTCLAIYFFVTLVLVRPHWGRKLLIIFNLTAWPIPLVICIFAVSFGVLGQSNHLTSAGWCFVALNGTNKHYSYNYTTYLLLEAAIGKAWEFIFFVVVIVCYGAIFYVNRKCGCLKSSRSSSYGFMSSGSSISTVDCKLFFVPIVFILLRLPGAYRYILSATGPCLNHNTAVSCVRKDCFDVGWNYNFIFVQAFCAPLQGFGNAVLFVFLSKHIMKRFVKQVISCCRSKSRPERTTEQVNEGTFYSASITAYHVPKEDSFYVSYSPAMPRKKTPTTDHKKGHERVHLLHDSNQSDSDEEDFSIGSPNARIHYGSTLIKTASNSSINS